MIFPCLKGRSLPLFLFTDYNIQMEFEMNFSDEYAYDTSMNHAQTAVRDYMCGSTLVGFNDVNLVIDYMLPPSSVINNFLKQTQQQGGYRFEFPEISVVKKKLLAVPVSKQPPQILILQLSLILKKSIMERLLVQRVMRQTLIV